MAIFAGWTINSEIDTILFDCWDTLVKAPTLMRAGASIELFYKSLTDAGLSLEYEVFEKVYRDLTDERRTEADSDGYRELDYHKLLSITLMVLQVDEERREKLSKKAIQEYRDEWIKQTDFFSETIEVLDALKHDHKLGVVTNYSCGPTARKVFKKLNFDKYFDAIAVSAEVGYRKPNRLLFEIALKELNSTPEKAVMIGDTFGADIVGARNLGIRNILIDSDGRQRENHHLTDVVVTNIGEVLEVIRQK